MTIGPLEEYAATVFCRRSWCVALLGVACQAAAPSRPAVREGSLEARSADVCGQPGGEPPASEGLPPRAAEFCLDPYALLHSYDMSERQQSEAACERVLGAGCAPGAAPHVPLRVQAGRYLDAAALGSADVIASHFEDAALAFAVFTERLLGDRDPAELGVQAFEAPGVAVLDETFASAWRGNQVLWLRYASTEVPPDAELSRAQRALPALARALLTNIPAEPGFPAAVERLPERQRLPLGVRLPDSVELGVPGLGRSALGYYRDGAKRWRVLASVRPDADSAKDVLSTLRKHPSARKIKGAPLDAIELTVRRAPSEPEIQWVIGQRLEMIYGIGDEPRALPEHMSARAETSVKLSRHEKLVALTRVHHR